MLYDEFDIFVAKFTHQGRGEGQRFLESHGVALDEIKRLALYLHDAQMQSYLTGIPPEAAAVAAGARYITPASPSPIACDPPPLEVHRYFNRKDVAYFNPAHLVHKPSEELKRMTLPALYVQKEKLKEELRE